jgi:ketosteroid isomerase-like protein
MTSVPGIDDMAIDVEALNRKYEEERDQRKRGDALGQFQPLQGRFAAFGQDPYAAHRRQRLRAGMLCAMLLAAATSAHAQDGRRTAIEATDAAFSAAVSRGDSKALAALYTVDGEVMPQGSDPIKGTDAIQKFLQEKIIGAGVAGATLKTLEVFGTGATASEVGAYEMRNKSGVVIDHGRYMVIWRQVDGVWKIHRDMFSSSGAPKP